MENKDSLFAQMLKATIPRKLKIKVRGPLPQRHPVKRPSLFGESKEEDDKIKKQVLEHDFLQGDIDAEDN